MSHFRNVVNDGSNRPPRLRMQYNAWALTNLPRGGEKWTVDQQLDQVRQAGFTGFEATAGNEAEADELAGKLQQRGLEIGFAAFATTPDDLKQPIQLALRMKAQYLTAQVNGPLMMSVAEIADTLVQMHNRVTEAGLPFFVETHRGRVTQDLQRTVQLLARAPQLRLTGDFSHYVVAGDYGGVWPAEVIDAFGLIASRCGNWHGRIGNGQQVQNDIGDGGGAMARQFVALWRDGFAAWLKEARPGDVLPFCCELGPPPYSIVDLDGGEISDRWGQSLVVKRLAEDAWRQATHQV